MCKQQEQAEDEKRQRACCGESCGSCEMLHVCEKDVRVSRGELGRAGWGFCDEVGAKLRRKLTRSCEKNERRKEDDGRGLQEEGGEG